MSKIVVSKAPNFGGRPTKYNKEKHIQLLHDIFSSGRGVMGFCADALIDRKTFYNWLKQYKEFKEAYDIVINIAGDKWERWPIEALKLGAFNYQYWHLIMRNRFHYSGINIPESAENSTQGKFESAWKGLTNGSLTPSEYNQTVNGIMAELKAKELELKAKELELRQKELENQSKSNSDVSWMTDEMIKGLMLMKEGKVKFVPAEPENSAKQEA